MIKDKRISVSLNEETYNKLVEKAKEENRSISNYVRILIEENLKEERK